MKLNRVKEVFDPVVPYSIDSFIDPGVLPDNDMVEVMLEEFGKVSLTTASGLDHFNIEKPIETGDKAYLYLIDPKPIKSVTTGWSCAHDVMHVLWFVCKVHALPLKEGDPYTLEVLGLVDKED